MAIATALVLFNRDLRVHDEAAAAFRIQRKG
jgi:deoxyribodipyrimidine photolyase